MLRAKGMRVARTVRSYELNWAAWLRMPSWVFGLPPGGTPDAGHTQCECTHSDVRRGTKTRRGFRAHVFLQNHLLGFYLASLA